MARVPTLQRPSRALLGFRNLGLRALGVGVVRFRFLGFGVVGFRILTCKIRLLGLRFEGSDSWEYSKVFCGDYARFQVLACLLGALGYGISWPAIAVKSGLHDV